MSERGSKLICQLVQFGDFDGTTSNALIHEFFDGHPIEDLKILTRSCDPDIVAVGAWILSEMGVKSRSIFEETEHLLGHPLWKARFWAIDSALSTANETDHQIVKKVLLLLSDPDSRVRRKVVDFLSKKNIGTILSSKDHFKDDARFTEGFHITSSYHKREDEKINNALQSVCNVTRFFGAAFAARIAREFASYDLLNCAAKSPDIDIRKFAQIRLENRISQ